MSKRRKMIIGIAFGIGAAMAYGTSSVLIRKGTTTMTPPLVGAAVSLLAGTLTLLIFKAGELKSSLSQSRKATGFLLLSGITAGLGILSSFFALSQAPVVIVSPIQSTSPLFALVWSALFLRRLEKITPRLIIGSILVMLGIVLITVNRTG